MPLTYHLWIFQQQVVANASDKHILYNTWLVNAFFCLFPANSDYLPLNQTLVFGPVANNPSQCVMVTVEDDEILEDSETFSVTLNTGDPDIILSPPSTVTILDNDCKEYILHVVHVYYTVSGHACVYKYSMSYPPLYQICHSFTVVNVSLQQDLYVVLEDAGSVTVCASLSGENERMVVVSLSTQPDTAAGKTYIIMSNNSVHVCILCVILAYAATADYGSTTALLTFEPADMEECVTIPIVNDTILEDNEFFSVMLVTSDSGVMFTRVMSSVEIMDDDCKQHFFACPLYYI